MKYIQIPIDEKTGTPIITSKMKAECIAEFSIKFPEFCVDCQINGKQDDCSVCNGKGEYMRNINVPWNTCKDIYKAMVNAAKID